MRLKGKIKRWIAEAKVRLLLQAWTVFISFDLDEPETLMCVSCLSANREAHVRINFPACSRHDDTYVRSACFHEMSHVLIWELAEMAARRFVSEQEINDADEKLAEVIAKIAQ